MAEMTEAYDWGGRTLLDTHGEKIGEIDQVYLNLETHQPEWALVDTGLFGNEPTFVPVGSARPTGEHVQVQVERDQVRDAPAINTDRELSPADEVELLRHYGVEYRGKRPLATRPPELPSASTGDGSITRSGEELHVRTVRRARTRVRLRKYIVTEMVTKTVPVRREEARLEREPIPDAEPVSVPAHGWSDEVHELVLHEEQLVIEKRVVPTERVRMRKQTLTEQQTVSDEIRKERIETSVRGDG